jgi:uncharacterized protein YecE (DUF72 family)
MRVLTGTSGYSYPAWRGRFYPDALPASRMLSAYAGRLPTVEINATFYRMPTAEVVAGWRAAVPAGFRFALKAPQRITHRLRLREAADPVGRLYQVAAEMGGSLGPILYQLPPNLKADLPRLTDFLALLPRGAQAAFEFRHPSWLADGVLDALRAAGAALCLADSLDASTPPIATAGFGYLRLRRPDYDEEALRTWAARIAAMPWTEAFVFFKHEDEARGPLLALRMAELVGEGDQAGAAAP